MCQKPQANARNKRRLTKRLAEWRAKQGGQALPKESAKKAEVKS